LDPLLVRPLPTPYPSLPLLYSGDSEMQGMRGRSQTRPGRVKGSSSEENPGLHHPDFEKQKGAF